MYVLTFKRAVQPVMNA